jgi:hypothetical protein
MQELGYDINAVNRSGRAVGDSVDFDPRSTGEQTGIQVSGGRGFGQTLDSRKAGGRSAGAKVATNRPEMVEWDSGMEIGFVIQQMALHLMTKLVISSCWFRAIFLNPESGPFFKTQLDLLMTQASSRSSQ